MEERSFFLFFFFFEASRGKDINYCSLQINDWELGEVEGLLRRLKGHVINGVEDVTVKDENIGNHGYIGTSILWIYRIYRRYIDGYWKKILVDLKLLKTHRNARKTS